MCQTLCGVAFLMRGTKGEKEELRASEASLQEGQGGAFGLRPPPKLKEGDLCISDCSPASFSVNICFFSGWGWGEKRRKRARGNGGWGGLPFPLSTLTGPSALGN